MEGSDGVLAYVEPSEAVTPVVRDTLDGMWIIPLYDSGWATITQVQFLILQPDVGIGSSNIRQRRFLCKKYCRNLLFGVPRLLLQFR